MLKTKPMQKFVVEITETLQRCVEVEAENENEAIIAVKRKYRKEEIVLYPEDFVDVEFDILPEECL